MNQPENKPYGSPTFKILMLVCGIAGIFIFGRAAGDINRISEEQAQNPAPVVVAQPVEPAAPMPAPVLRSAAELTQDERLWAAGVMAGANCKAAGGTEPATVRAAYEATLASRGIDGASVAGDATIVDASKTIYMQQCPGQLMRERGQ
jgi:hypothetical protein